MSQNKRYIPLNTGESAVLPDADTLLPRNEVYEPLAKKISEAVKKAESAQGKTLNALREHNAISIDGARGTGKTAVLVNLKSYLDQDKHKHILSKVHILDPVDPTLLEDGESLFLHIIVAAVLHDKDVKEQQRNKPNKARSLNQTLDKLAQSLESVETQKSRHGMDKVRAMYSNKHLADCVQDFFHDVLDLLGKKLLILPIDDVDTALDRAFENLEIVRRYLATPYVLPIVSGDRGLYNQVTWRDFHGRLTEDSKHLPDAAYEMAVELAEEYQRKILPFPRRLTMPEVSSYWQQSDIYLRDGQAELIPLRNFIAWLEIFLAGPVNGLEGSRLSLPIPSIRALTQLVRHFSDFIPELPMATRESNEVLEVRRNWQMPSVPLDKAARKKRNEFAQNLADYFCFESKAGATYLVLLAKLHWQDWFDSSSSRRRNLLDTPLFQPLAHATAKFELFDKADDLSAWPILLKERLPEEWLAGIKTQKTILPYPVAEVGVNSSKRWGYVEEIRNLEIDGLDDDKKSKAGFLIALLAQHNFYTNAKQTMLLNIGRVFELLISSIAGPLSAEDIYAIVRRAPFFSTAALAPTKTITIDENTSSSEEDVKGTQGEDQDISSLVTELHQEIETWRRDYQVDQIELSPWLVYKVFNKVFSQVASNEKVPNGMKNIDKALSMAAHAFYATWFAFGSFEKGELFGLSNIVTTTNINPKNLKKYTNNDQFNLNIKPIMQAFDENKSLKAVSVVLAEHPIKKWIDEVINFDFVTPEKKAQEYLREQLSISASASLTKSAIKSKANLQKNKDKLDSIYEYMKNNFGAHIAVVTTFKTVCDEVANELTQNSTSKKPTPSKTKNQTPVGNTQQQPEAPPSEQEQEQTPAETVQAQANAQPTGQEQDKDSQ